MYFIVAGVAVLPSKDAVLLLVGFVGVHLGEGVGRLEVGAVGTGAAHGRLALFLAQVALLKLVLLRVEPEEWTLLLDVGEHARRGVVHFVGSLLVLHHLLRSIRRKRFVPRTGREILLLHTVPLVQLWKVWL